MIFYYLLTALYHYLSDGLSISSSLIWFKQTSIGGGGMGWKITNFCSCNLQIWCFKQCDKYWSTELDLNFLFLGVDRVHGVKIISDFGWREAQGNDWKWDRGVCSRDAKELGKTAPGKRKELCWLPMNLDGDDEKKQNLMNLNYILADLAQSTSHAYPPYLKLNPHTTHLYPPPVSFL